MPRAATTMAVLDTPAGPRAPRPGRARHRRPARAPVEGVPRLRPQRRARVRAVGARHRAVGHRRQGGRPAAVAAVRRDAGHAAHRPTPACCATARRRMVAAACERAIARGYRDIKLHEITVPEVARGAAGDRSGRAADGRYQLSVDGLAGDRHGAPHARVRPDLARGTGLAARRSRRPRARSPRRRCADRRRRECRRPARLPRPVRGRRDRRRAAERDQDRRALGDAGDRRAGEGVRRARGAAQRLFRRRASWRRCMSTRRSRRTRRSSGCSSTWRRARCTIWWWRRTAR